MCIGLPMQVMRTEPGHALCAGRGESRRVRTALVGEVAPGDWLLLFIDSAIERLDAGRAAEINATLDLLQAAIAGPSGSTEAGAAPDDLAGGSADPGFDLPSRWTTDELRALSGQAAATAQPLRPTDTLLESTP